MNVTVYFVGIGAHVLDSSTAMPAGNPQAVPSGSAVRVVFVNARLGARIAETSIPPHNATLIIDPRFIAGPVPEIPGLRPVDPNEPAEWAMDGVQLTLANIVPGLTLDPSYAAIPSLTLSAGVPSLQLNEEYLAGGSPLAIFEVTAGTLAAYAPDKAVVGVLSAPASGTPQLVVTRRWDQQTTVIPLQQASMDGEVMDPIIILSNVGQDRDTPADFLLHYLVTTYTPTSVVQPQSAVPAPPEPPEFLPQWWREILPTIGLTLGCSNSVYP